MLLRKAPHLVRQVSLTESTDPELLDSVGLPLH